MPKKINSITNAWDLIGDDSYASRVKEALLASKHSKSNLISEVDDVRSKLIHIPEFAIQALINSWGLMQGRIIDVIATDGIGKSTLLFTVAGWAMKAGCPCYYQETENKLMAPERIKRCLSTDKAQAEKFYSRLIIDQVSDIKTAVMNLENFVIESRDANSAIYVPQHIPIVCFQDTFSKLMSPGEAEGVSVYEGDRAPVTELGTNANPEAAKIAHSWARRWPYFLSHYNVILFFARHLNDKVDMSGGGGGSFGGGSIAGDAYNRTSRGGKAFNQNAALQMTLSRIKYLSAKIDGQDEKVGVQGQITVVKNSYGADGKKIQYVINTVPRTDTDTYQEPSMSFVTSTCDWLFNHKLLPMTKKNNNCYTAKSLDLYDVPCDEFHRVFHSKPELIEQLGKQLGIYGYTNAVAEPVTPAVAQESPAPDADNQETLPSEPSASPTDIGDQVADAGGGVIRVKRKYTKRKK